MKKINIIYWIFTILLAVGMLLTCIPGPDNVKFIHGLLGFPEYMIPFLAIAKVLGVIVVLIPGFPRLKEWAYAGLTFDLLGATYANASIAGGFKIDMWPMLLYFVVLFVSYIYYHKRLKAKATNNA